MSMMVSRQIYHFLLAVVFSLAAWSSHAADVEGVVSKLQKKYESVSTVSASFTQEAYSKALNQTQTSSGKVYLKKPGKMRWVYENPRGDELVSNGKKIWLFQPDLNQVIEQPVEEAAAAMAVDFLTGVGSIRKDFTVATESEAGGSIRLLLTPREPQPNIRSLRLEVDKGSYLVLKTAVEDIFGNVTRVSFTDIAVNTPMKDSFFEFSAPKGATVVRP